MTRIKVWDPLVRLFHWLVVFGMGANILLIDDESALHEWVGYGVVGLVVVRIIWGLIGSRYARFSSFPFDIPTQRWPNLAIYQPDGGAIM